MATVSSNILITFDMLIDLDIGLFSIIKESYNDPNVFNNKVLNMNENRLKGLLRENIYRNPLNLILLNDNPNQANAFYNEFMEVEYDNIIDHSPNNTIVDVVRTFIASGAISVTILCKNKSESARIERILSDYETNQYEILVSENNNINLDKYDTMFIKYIDDLDTFNNVIAKNLIISDYRYNLDDIMYDNKQKIPDSDLAGRYSLDNEFRTVTLYHYDESYYE